MAMINGPHQRYNPLNDTWVLVCPNRAKRPWQGKVHEQTSSDIQNSTPSETVVSKNTNPLAPGATRANGKVNPMYTSVYTFPNDFPALLPPPSSHRTVSQQQSSNNFDQKLPEGVNRNCEVVQTEIGKSEDSDDDLFVSKKAYGHCEVMCFHPDATLTIPVMSEGQIRTVIDSWCDRMQHLATQYTWVQIFENKGQIMGCSNPHPHCQIWASDFLPQEPAKQDSCQRRYKEKHGSNLLLDYVTKELKQDKRVVVKNDHWAAIVPYWALWPFETIIIPLQHRLRLIDLNSAEKDALANIMKVLTIKYDNLFACSFPYSMGFHGAPTGKNYNTEAEDVFSHWQLHLHYFPPLLRSATVQKFMVGYEMLAQPQRDITPEMAAEYLKKQSTTHYTQHTENSEQQN